MEPRSRVTVTSKRKCSTNTMWRPWAWECNGCPPTWERDCDNNHTNWQYRLSKDRIIPYLLYPDDFWRFSKNISIGHWPSTLFLIFLIFHYSFAVSCFTRHRDCNSSLIRFMWRSLLIYDDRSAVTSQDAGGITYSQKPPCKCGEGIKMWYLYFILFINKLLNS